MMGNNVKPGAGAPASAQEVKNFHNKSDVDHDHNSQHHTLGLGPNQAAPGNHEHLLTSPNGSKWRLTVSNAGTLTAVLV